MYHKAVTSAVISHHEDDDIDLLYHCHVFAYLFSVSGLPSFKEYIF